MTVRKFAGQLRLYFREDLFMVSIYLRNVWKFATPVLMNVKNIPTWSIAKDALKNAGIVQKSAVKWHKVNGVKSSTGIKIG